jgi:hypothetical protein
MIDELQVDYQPERRATPRGSPLRPGPDRPIWQGSGTLGTPFLRLICRSPNEDAVMIAVPSS